MKMEDSYDDLVAKYKALQAELEKVNQALYDCRRVVKSTQTIELEYQEEIKVLQNQGIVEQQKLQLKIQQLEENNLNLKTSYNERLQYLENELLSKDTDIDKLKTELDNIVKIGNLQEPVANDKLLEELALVREENVRLLQQVSELELASETREKANLEALEKIKQLEENLHDYKEILKSKKEELEEANSLIQNLRDEILCMKSELDCIRSQPLNDQSKGNSLFAEVDDRRLQLQKNMNLMKTKYIQMKSERASLLKQITKLRNANATLIAQRENEVIGKQSDEEMIIESYKDQIQTLNDLIKSYQKELKEKPSFDATSPDVVKFFDNMLDKKSAEMEDMRQKLLLRSVSYTTLSYDLAEAKKQLRKANLEIQHLKNEIIDMEVKIQEVELHNKQEDAAAANMPESILKTEEGDKENIITKKVQFSALTEEPHVTDRSKYKKGAKVIISKPIDYS